ncbi:hypothetical protein ACL6C3_08905 [Capilliphycus salinus ALCB114379]|uniref:hypothetical protein n=1 Tax=Capilliphycus salinus TaxID=2768948 RepID=UPI0039A68C63
MTAPSKYWTMQIISASRGENHQLKDGYKSITINQAQEFFKRQFPELAGKLILSSAENRLIQVTAWNKFRSATDIYERALAGLCLRCYISQTIVIACKKIPHTSKAGVEKLFSYTDLLAFVLNDDSKQLVILDGEGQTQLILNPDGTTQPLAKGGEFFSVEILRTFDPNLSSGESLRNWTWRLTQQHQKLKLFLWEFGVRTPSDWGLLCKRIPQSLEPHFQPGDREIVEVFHAVYRRDRRRSNQKGRCCEPTPEQLQEMLHLLQQRKIPVSSLKELIVHFKRIAEILRQDLLCRKTGSPKTIPTEIYDSSTNDYVPNPELFLYNDPAPEEVEFNQLKEKCNALFERVLYQAIAEVLSQHLEYLSKSKGYKSFAQKFYEGLQLYYQENKSLGEIAKLWGIPWCKARRIFQLENLLDKVKERTVEKLIEELTQWPHSSKLVTISQDPDSLKNFADAIRDYAHEKTFKDSYA